MKTITDPQKESMTEDDKLLAITSSISHLAVGDQIQELSKHLQNISVELQNQVRENYGVLLQQATATNRSAINQLAADVLQIRASGHKLKSSVDAQYQLLDNQTRVLGHLHETSHLLRSAGTLLSLTAQLGATSDVLKQAELHYELSQLVDDADLKGIEFLQPARNHVVNSRQKLRNLTQMQLVTGLQERNESQVVHALKVFHNFQTLDQALEHLNATFIANLEQSLKECFAGTDITVLSGSTKNLHAGKTSGSAGGAGAGGPRGPGKTPLLTTTQNFRAKFWKSLHWLLYDELFECCEQTRLLHRALAHVHQVLGVPGADAADVAGQQQRFWPDVQKLLRQHFTNCPAHIAQTLQEGLAKLLTSARGLEQRLRATAEGGGSSDEQPAGAAAIEFRFADELFTPFTAGYVSKCGANFKACLAGVDLPNNETVDRFVRTAAAELSAALVDARLSAAVAAVFAGCGQELCTKLEGQIRMGADAAQVVDLPNIQQSQNTLLANILFYYADSARRLLADLSTQFARSPGGVEARDIIANSLDQPDRLVASILQQLMDSIRSTISIILLSMHREPGLASERLNNIAAPSMYMKELQEFVARVWHNHVLAFDHTTLVAQCGQELAKRCISMFVHNICILRPLSALGRQRLQNDCGHLELALRPICANLSALGHAARLLRAISFLIIRPPAELVAEPVGGEVGGSLVPPYLVLFVLFGHAGSELQSPHTTVDWSNERLLEWLDGHTAERERLEIISGALQRYRDNVRRRNSTAYDPLYPLMVEFFEKASKAAIAVEKR